MPLISASNETQAEYCALMFLGVPLINADTYKSQIDAWKIFICM